MGEFSPKIEIINHFDNMINRMDIEIEECLLKYNEEQTLGDLEFIRNEEKIPFCFLYFFTSSLKPNNNQCVESWSQSTKVIDYLNQIRKRTIDELREAQKDSIDYFNSSVSSHYKIHYQQTDEMKLDEIKSQIFGEKFYSQVLYKPKEDEERIFNLYTIATDFYMSPTDINLLEKMINADTSDLNLLDSYSNIIFDEKMVLIGLIQKFFFENLNNTQEFSNYLIRVSRKDLLNVRSITCHYAVSGVNLTYCLIDLPLKLERLVLRGKRELEEIKIEDLLSLKSLDLKLYSVERVKLRNLIALQDLTFELLENPINSDIQEKLFDQLPNVHKLTIIGHLSDFNLDNIIHLQDLSLKGLLDKDFAYDLIKNLCNQLTDLTINCSNFDDESMNKLFVDHHFPNLSKLRIMNTKITKLGSKIFSRFQQLRDLTIYNNREIRIVYDTFSSLKQLTRLKLTENYFDSPWTKDVDKKAFSELTNLEYLKISGKFIIKEFMFTNLKNLKHLDFSNTRLDMLILPLFFGLEKLEILNLQKCQGTYFDLIILDNLSQLKILDLSGNASIINENRILKQMKDYPNIEFKFLSIC